MKFLKFILCVMAIGVISCTSSDTSSNPLLAKLQGKWKFVAQFDPVPQQAQYTIEYFSDSHFIWNANPYYPGGRYSISSDSVVHLKIQAPSRPDYDEYKQITKITADSLIFNDPNCIEGCPEVFIKVNP